MHLLGFPSTAQISGPGKVSPWWPFLDVKVDRCTKPNGWRLRSTSSAMWERSRMGSSEKAKVCTAQMRACPNPSPSTGIRDGASLLANCTGRPRGPMVACTSHCMSRSVLLG